MAERYLVTPDVPEQLKLKKETNEKLAEEKAVAVAAKKKLRSEMRGELKARQTKYEKEYSDNNKKLIELRRQAKAEGNFFVEPEPKLIFCVRIFGIIKLSPKLRKVLQLLRLRQLHNGVFLKVNKPIINLDRISRRRTVSCGPSSCLHQKVDSHASAMASTSNVEEIGEIVRSLLTR